MDTIKQQILLLLLVLTEIVAPMRAASPPPSAAVRLTEAARLADKEHFTEALEQLTDIMRQAETEHDDKTYIACTGYIGNIYNTFGDYNSCAAYYLKGYNAAVKAGDRELQASFLTNIVNVYCHLGQPRKARYYLDKAERTPSKRNPVGQRYFVLYNSARILTAEHRYAEAVAAHRLTLAYARAHKMQPVYTLYQLSEIGNLYVLMHHNKQAIAIGDSCLALSRQLGSGELITNAYKMLADAYAHDGQADSARRYRDLYFMLSDSVYNTQKFFNARHKVTQYEEELNLRELLRLNTRITYQTYVIISTVFFLLLLGVFTWIIVRKNRRLMLTQRLLIDKNEEMEHRDKQTQALLSQYVAQVKSAPAAPEVADSATEKQPKASSVRINEDEERRLLNRINEVMGDSKVISNPDFSLQLLAEAVQSNTKYVSHVINSSYHKPFKTLLNELRIRQACHKLTDTEHYGRYTMQAIYEEVGYTNSVSFIRAFKKVYGMLPSEYRKLAAREKQDNE